MPKAAVNGIELAYEVYGEGPPLVLAHGWAASKEMWAGQIGAFSEHYRVIVYDMRGHGESSAPHEDDAGYTLEAFVADQWALLTHLGIERAHIGGLSMGGMIAMRFALTHPGRVRSLLLCDTSPGGGMMSGITRQWRANRELIEGFVRSQGVAALAQAIYLQGTQALGSNGMPGGVTQFIEGLGHMQLAGFLGAGRALSGQESVDGRLSEITAPTLILTGERDFMRGPSEEMKQRLPHARFVMIRDAYHGTCLWQPERFTAAVLDFLASVEAGRDVAGHEER